MRRYKLKRYPNGHKKDGQPYMLASLTVPPWIADLIHDDQLFEVKLTPEGILYTPVDRIGELPEWVKQ